LGPGALATSHSRTSYTEAPVNSVMLAGGRSSVYRFHLDSPIPFTKSFQSNDRARQRKSPLRQLLLRRLLVSGRTACSLPASATCGAASCPRSIRWEVRAMQAQRYIGALIAALFLAQRTNRPNLDSCDTRE
jgi:hypothetical protein